jgi:hypothetical protein
MKGLLTIGTGIATALATIAQIDQKTVEHGLPLASETAKDIKPLIGDSFSLMRQLFWLRATQTLDSSGKLSEAGEQQDAQIQEQLEAVEQKFKSRVEILGNDIKEKGLSVILGSLLALPAFVLFKLPLPKVLIPTVFALSLLASAATAAFIKFTGGTLPASFALGLKEINVSSIKDSNNNILTSTLREAGINYGPDYIATASVQDLEQDIKGIGAKLALNSAIGGLEVVKDLPFMGGLASWMQNRAKDVANLSFQISGSNFTA